VGDLRRGGVRVVEGWSEEHLARLLLALLGHAVEVPAHEERVQLLDLVRHTGTCPFLKNPKEAQGKGVKNKTKIWFRQMLKFVTTFLPIQQRVEFGRSATQCFRPFPPLET
jgi:hypothetical protein